MQWRVNWENEKVIDTYKKEYAGRMVTIYYNPDDIEEFYVKEIEEYAMLKGNKEFHKNNAKSVLEILGVMIVLMIFIGILICIGGLINVYILRSVLF